MNEVLRPIKSYEDFDHVDLTRELDRVKSDLFSRPYASFFAPLACSMDFVWTLDCRTAQTDGAHIAWNPNHFLKLQRPSRLTVFMHEVEHTGRLHFDRVGSRDYWMWNQVTDLKINNSLMRRNYSFDGLNVIMNLDVPEDALEEDLYERLERGELDLGNGDSFGDTLSSPGYKGEKPEGDFRPDGLFGPMTKEERAAVINNVIRACEQAKLSGPGSMPGDTEYLLNQYLKPIIPWERELHSFFTELQDGGYTWQRPNRRHTASGLYLPSRWEEEGGLAHVAFIDDVSGSIKDADIIRFHSEFKYCKERFDPRKIAHVQFDTIIQDVKVYEQDDEFEPIKVIGRGGTCLYCVREWIEENRPTAVVVFSDLYCGVMRKPSFDVPIIWVTVGNPQAEVETGKLIHIR